MTSPERAPRRRLVSVASSGRSSISGWIEPDAACSSSLATKLFDDSTDRVTDGSSVSWPSRSTGSPASRSRSDWLAIAQMVARNRGIRSRMEEADFDHAARDELRHIEDAFADVDPDQVDVSVSDGVLRLDLRDGTKIVINSHRAARQIWMAAIASAWHFDPVAEGRWIAAKSGDDLRATGSRLLHDHLGLTFPL